MVQGLPSLKRKLNKKIPALAREAAKQALEQNARELVAEMKRLAPKDTRALANSINWTWGDAPAGSMVLGTVAGNKYSTMRITVYAGDESTIVTNSRGVRFQNAFLQEFGTKNMPPSPFFYPSYRGLRRKMKGRVTRSINKALKKA